MGGEEGQTGVYWGVNQYQWVLAGVQIEGILGAEGGWWIQGCVFGCIMSGVLEWIQG